MYKITKEEVDESEFDEDIVFQTEKLDTKHMEKYFEQQELLRKMKEEGEKEK
jgi:hypothetical protein